MSSMEPARADGRRNRQLILEAAMVAMLENPQASISDVAERAGVTRATVYRHYSDRDVLLQAMATETARQIIPALLDELRPLPWLEALELLAERVVSTGEAYREMILTVAPQLEHAVRIAVEDEPIQAEIAIRRASGWRSASGRAASLPSGASPIQPSSATSSSSIWPGRCGVWRPDLPTSAGHTLRRRRRRRTSSVRLDGRTGCVHASRRPANGR